MSKTYVTKIYQQRTSLVTSLPMEVRNRLGLTKGEHLVWQVDKDSNFVQISCVVAGGKSNEECSGNSARKDKGGRA